MTRVGIISDTHGLLRPQAVAALTGVDHILHAGDVGDPAILDALGQLAPLTAISGNIDEDGHCGMLPSTDAVELGGKLFYLIHSVHDLEINPVAAGVDVVVSGHSHRANVEVKNGVTYLNPGSAGPLRFSLPCTLALVTVDGATIRSEVINLPVRRP